MEISNQIFALNNIIQDFASHLLKIIYIDCNHDFLILFILQFKCKFHTTFDIWYNIFNNDLNAFSFLKFNCKIYKELNFLDNYLINEMVNHIYK